MVDSKKLEIYKISFGSSIRYQYVTVPAQSTARIYLFTNWGNNFRAFIDQVAIGPDCLPWNLVEFQWLVDGAVIDRFQYQIARLYRPKHFEPPFLARRIIEWIGVNNDVVPHVFEVICDGVLASKEY